MFKQVVLNYPILIVITILIIGGLVQNIQINHIVLDSTLLLTYVHGSPQAQLNHSQAMDFCRNLWSNVLKFSTYEDFQIFNRFKNTNTAQHYTIHSDLLSLHDPVMIRDLMSWINKVKPYRFWIGAKVKSIEYHFDGVNKHNILVWTDKTQPRLQYFQTYEDMNLGEVRCVSVDYSNGQWTLYPCNQTLFFVCQSVKLPSFGNQSPYVYNSPHFLQHHK